VAAIFPNQAKIVIVRKREKFIECFQVMNTLQRNETKQERHPNDAGYSDFPIDKIAQQQCLNRPLPQVVD
jgi:hypothetical protein